MCGMSTNNVSFGSNDNWAMIGVGSGGGVAPSNIGNGGSTGVSGNLGRGFRTNPGLVDVTV